MKGAEFLGTSKDDLKSFPKVPRQIAGRELTLVQNGKDPANWKAMPSVGSGVKEIRIQVGEQFRIIYIATRPEAVYVLHAFQKKSRKTAQRDIDLAKKRLKELKEQP